MNDSSESGGISVTTVGSYSAKSGGHCVEVQKQCSANVSQNRVPKGPKNPLKSLN